MTTQAAPLSSYRELGVWRKGIDLVEAVYRLTRTFPPEERYGLVSQMQRAAVSVPANIAEGYGRVHRGDYVHHLSVARGSLLELETHLTIAVRIHLATQEQADEACALLEEVSKMLRSLIASLSK